MKPQRYGFLIGLNNPICKEKPPEKLNYKILSVEQYKPKEIAATLGLSYAYVRNVQVELRKLTQQNGFSSFQELKLL